MKRIRRNLLMIILSLCVLMIPAHSLQAKVKLNSTSIVLVKGSSKTLKVSGTKKKASWKTGKKSIATVSGKGVVKAKKAGNTTITVKVAGKKLKCKVKVVALNKTKVVLPYVGSKYTLKASNGSGTKWSSSNSNIVSVSSSGVLQAKKTGLVTITCTTRGKKIKCNVYVPELNVSEVHLTHGNTFTLRLIHGDGTPTFSSSNSSVVAVDAKKGLCKGLNYGTAIVTAKIGSYAYNCVVTVVDKGDITTPYTMISSSTKKTKYVQKVNAADGEVRSYTVFGQGYSGTKFTSNLTLYVANGVVVPKPTSNPVATNPDGSTDPVNPPVTPTENTYKVKSYIANHGCAACSTTTLLTGYAGYDGEPTDFVSQMELSVFGYKSWNANYSKSESSQMPISLWGAQQILSANNVPSTYRRTFSGHRVAIDEIRKHLLKGKPVLICVGTKNRLYDYTDSRWTGGRHTMALLGMTDDYKVIVADPADRGNSGFGSMGRIKIVELLDVCAYLWSTPNPNSSNASKPYYVNADYNGGYLLVDYE